MNEGKYHSEIAQLRTRLVELSAECVRIERRLAELEATSGTSREISQLTTNEAANTLGQNEKVALFRSLFAGRADMFPLRWENTKTGRAGYAPACANVLCEARRYGARSLTNAM